ncbi:uncharacterized protein LOC129093469 [Anoplopoma fimbria]|uniref:uncharacterized protein LOC129093469 n=1 Tax=Anoplopoma fimbria TaxID=229290 RepID=UPI0023EDB85F|nr:uncharacterized protein LOC129093469 [Anoplopoma fimbria]
MTFTADFLTFLTFTSVVMVCHCTTGDTGGAARRPPPPTGLSYEWIDPFTVNVSWQKPSGLSGGNVSYQYNLLGNKNDQCTRGTNLKVNLLTEESVSGSWNYSIRTIVGGKCDGKPISSTFANITIKTGPRAEVKDIKCLISPNMSKIKCSWTPVNQKLKLFYRICGISEEHMKDLRECNLYYVDAMRRGCWLEADAIKDICLLFKTDTGSSTFKLAPMIEPPALSVKEEGDKLKLSWRHPKFGCIWNYSVCTKKCGYSEECQNFITKNDSMFIPYDKSCRYEFWSSVRTDDYCPSFSSDRGQVVIHGTNKPADESLTVVAIVLPIILSVCIFLSCYCFSRHSAIICPVIPDPSAIFKEMMMNGNKEITPTTGGLYTPVPEPVESCKVDPVTDIIVPLNL